jgi:hypothetical protein
MGQRSFLSTGYWQRYLIAVLILLAKHENVRSVRNVACCHGDETGCRQSGISGMEIGKVYPPADTSPLPSKRRTQQFDESRRPAGNEAEAGGLSACGSSGRPSLCLLQRVRRQGRAGQGAIVAANQL